MKNAHFLLAGCILSASMIFGSTAVHAEGVAAGTLIENTASASYDAGGGTETVDSNTVVLLVDELLDVTVASLDAGPVATDTGSAVLTFSVTNTGNGPEAFNLTADPVVTGNDFETTVDSIAIDTNGNGIYEPGIDQILTSPEQTAVLAADEAITVFVLVTVPGTAADTEQSQVDLLAEAVTGTGAPGTIFAGEGEGGGDAVAGPNGADDNDQGALIVGIATVDLVKSAVVVDPFGGATIVPGAVITYTITANVAGSGSVDSLLISDPIPAGTTYSGSSLTLDSNGLTDAADTDEGSASDAAGVAVDLGTVAGGTTHSITFDVTID